MSAALEPEQLSRRRALSLLGLAGALSLAAPRILLTVSAAEAQTIPPAFNQADKPIPGEGGTARIPPQGDKPIVGEGAGTRRRVRRKRVHEQRANRRRRSKPRETQQPAGEDKPK